MKGPDFVLIGAMKCGTSTLAAQLGAQQGLFVTSPKEPNYFSDDDAFARGPGWYAALFDAAQANDLKGEASTHYTKLPDLPQTLPRMQAALTDVRVVYMIRDPLDRLVSHYIHEWSQGVIKGSLADALDRHPAMINYGLYGMQIAPWIETWGSNAVLLTSLERLRVDPQAELTRIAAHLGHDGPVSWEEDIGTQNVSAKRMRRLPLHGLLIDNPIATILRRGLVPKSLRARVRQARQMTVRPNIPDELVPDLQARFLADRTQLAAFFPDDLSLTLAYPWVSA